MTPLIELADKYKLDTHDYKNYIEFLKAVYIKFISIVEEYNNNPANTKKIICPKFNIASWYSKNFENFYELVEDFQLELDLIYRVDLN